MPRLNAKGFAVCEIVARHRCSGMGSVTFVLGHLAANRPCQQADGPPVHSPPRPEAGRMRDAGS
jgi:hypothetical protein